MQIGRFVYRVTRAGLGRFGRGCSVTNRAADGRAAVEGDDVRLIVIVKAGEDEVGRPIFGGVGVQVDHAVSAVARTEQDGFTAVENRAEACSTVARSSVQSSAPFG